MAPEQDPQGMSTLPVYEQAKQCPKCGQPGMQTATRPNQPRAGSRIEFYQCQNELCINHGENWIIQINSDGSIPVRNKGPKEFEMDKHTLDYGKAVVERTKHEMREHDPNDPTMQ